MRKPRSRIRGKKNAIVALYRKLPKRGHAVCFDEMGPLQTIPRGGKAWGNSPSRRPDRYRRNGTLQWLCAFSPHTGKAVGKGYLSKPAETVCDFWENYLLRYWPKGRIHAAPTSAPLIITRIATFVADTLEETGRQRQAA